MTDPRALPRIDYLRDLASRLKACGHGARGELLDAAQQQLGYATRQAVYAALQREVGWTSGRKPRADRGASAIDAEAVKKVAGMLHVATRDNNKALMSFETAIEVAAANAILSKPVAPSTIARRMRQEGVHPKQLKARAPSQEMRSLHPNHVWQIDASICVLYYLPGGRVRSMDAHKFNERKPANAALVIKERVLRYVATDHTSGTIFVRYYNAAGESAELVFDFLLWCFALQAERVAHGVPKMIVWDAGAANMAHTVQAMLRGLGVAHWAHRPGNSQAKGSVERAQDIVERNFEGLLRLSDQIQTIDDLDRRAVTWSAAFNGARKHSRHGQTRNAVWLTITAEQLRLCPPVDVCRQLLTSKPIERVVDQHLTISVAGETYDLRDLPGVHTGLKIEIVKNPFRAPNIWILQDTGADAKYLEFAPLPRDQYGFVTTAAVFGESFKSKPEADADKKRGDINQDAYGVRDQRDVSAVRAKGKVAFDGKIDPFKHIDQAAAELPTFIPKRGSELHVPMQVDVEAKPLTHFEALRALRALLGRSIEPHEAELVQTLHPAGVPESELTALVDRITGKSATTATPPRLRIVS